MSSLVLTPSPGELADILSCIKQFLRAKEMPKVCHVLTVWDSESANLYLNSNTQPGDYCIVLKTKQGYSDQENLTKIDRLWNNGLYPVELIRDGVGLFYSVPKIVMFGGDLTGAELTLEEYS